MQVQSPRVTTQVVVATSVMLSFISFWRAAAIVLNDLASTAYYIGGIAETAIGKAAPWFVLAIMLFSYAVRAVYIESCGMFVRGGVYRVVHEALGGTMAKFSVSALMFDYVLTGPISAVSAGLYLGGLINGIADQTHHPAAKVPAAAFATVFAVLVTIYFWRKNTIGIRESSQKALRIMQVTSVMVIILISWCLLTILTRGYQPVPLPIMSNLRFGREALGWLDGTFLPTISFIAILIGLGHSLLAMSGEESLAQVYREIKHPKLKNLEKTGLVIFLYSLLLTSLVSFFAVMIIPDAERGRYLDNLIGGLAVFLAGPMPLRLLFQAFVVITGTLILSGAVNTSIIGSNGVLNRVSEDGVLPDWFRHPHRKFGTTHRLINLVTALQILTIVISRGNVYLLGEAYAFGVMWSFFMKGLSVFVLRFKQPGLREWKVPLNFCWRGVELPVGLGLITLSLFLLAAINALTKKTATLSGLAFTCVLFIVFELSERHNRKRRAAHGTELEKFRVEATDDVAAGALHVRPGSVLVPVRNPYGLDHLRKVLAETDTARTDVVALSIRMLESKGSGEHALTAEQIFGENEVMLFSQVVTIAERAGKPVKLLAIQATHPELAFVRVAANLGALRIVAGASGKLTPDEQARRAGAAWEELDPPRPPLTFEIVLTADDTRFYELGPHPPRLWPEDVELAHSLWLELSARYGSQIHHRDVVGLALRRLRDDLHSPRAADFSAAIRGQLDQGK